MKRTRKSDAGDKVGVICGNWPEVMKLLLLLSRNTNVFVV